MSRLRRPAAAMTSTSSPSAAAAAPNPPEGALPASGQRPGESPFRQLEACPLCGQRKALRTHFETPLDAAPASDFIQSYYAGRIPLEVTQGQRFCVRHCTACDFYFHAEVLKPELAERLYNEWVDTDYSRSKQQARSAEERMHLCELVLRWLRALPRRPQHAELLDVGGGWGTLGACAQALGCRVTLLEASGARRRHAEGLGLNVVESLEALGGQQFDLVVMNQSLEHIPEPRSLLRAILERLRPGGGLAVDVPRASPTAPVLAKGPFQPLEHLNGFTARALEQLLTSEGLQLVADYTQTVPLSARSWARALARNARLKWGGGPAALDGEGLSRFGIKPAPR